MTDSTSTETTQPDVRAYIANRIGFLELNRPKALNALSVGMIRLMQQALDAWRDDPDVVAVVVHSPHPRA
ncbi:3-hydroxyisobutyryl-CoA hydrolase, partial [Burkholderia sp. TJI49]